MSDTAPVALLPYAIARAFKPKEVFGEPKRLLRKMKTHSEGDLEGQPIDGQYVCMGFVFGKINEVMVSQRPNRDGGVDRSYGLSGQFEAIPQDRERNPIRTGTAWFPTHIHDAISVLLRNYDPVDGEVREDGAETVEVSFEVGIKSNAKSSTGFTWEYKPLVEMKTTSDPLSDLRRSLPVGIVPTALPAPKHLEDDGEVEGTDRGDAPSEIEERQAGAAAANAPQAVSEAGKGHGKAKR